MATREELMSLGMPGELARGLGSSVQVTVTPAGSTQATAAAITAPCVVLATAAAGGVILPPSSGRAPHIVYNGSGNAQTVYATGNEQINAIAAASGLSVPSAKSATFIPTGQGWLANLSA